MMQTKHILPDALSLKAPPGVEILLSAFIIELRKMEISALSHINEETFVFCTVSINWVVWKEPEGSAPVGTSIKQTTLYNIHSECQLRKTAS